MQYYISKIVTGTFNEAVNKVTDLLSEEGFGIQFTIDVTKTLKEKLDVEYKDYLIMGACNPNLALRAFQAEDKIGTLLPCNVIVIDQGEGEIEVAAIDPNSLMGQIGNPELNVLALEASKRLNRVLAKM